MNVASYLVFRFSFVVESMIKTLKRRYCHRETFYTTDVFNCMQKYKDDTRN